MGRPRRPLPATDLTVPTSLAALNGAPVVDVARATLEAGASLVQAWRDLEPIVRKLTKKVANYVECDEFDGVEGAKLLSLSASVVQKVGQAATTVLRASEGQSRLAVLLDGGTRRAEPKHMTEKQLLAVMFDTVKKAIKEGSSCPFCTKTIETAVSNGESHA